MAIPMASSYQPPYASWDHSPYEQTQMMPMYMTTMPLESSLQAPHEVPTQSSHQRHQPRNSQSAPWTQQEDDTLRESKRRGLQWETIHKQYFPEKSGNACRKRYERLENKRRGTEWDDGRLQRLAVAYKELAPTIWEPLAQRLGERWQHVEKQCFLEGVKGLANKASYHSRQISSGSSRSHNSGNDHEHSSPQDDYEQENQEDDDDSGIALGLGNGNRRSSRQASSQHGRDTLDPGNLHTRTLQPLMYR